MGRKLTSAEYIVRANIKHNYKYNYDKTEYKGLAFDIVVTCPEHGDFSINPKFHIYDKLGCKACLPTINEHNFISRATAIHEDKYVYPNISFRSVNDYIDIICPHHGQFKQKVYLHLNSIGCPSCGRSLGSDKRRYTTETFIEKAIEIHGTKYDYSQVVYLQSKKYITIICPEHGEFEQKPYSHLEGTGCEKCSRQANAIGFSREAFLERFKDQECLLYVLKCFNNFEIFYKIGITGGSIATRYSSTAAMPYSFVVLKEIKGSPEDIWNLEKELLKKHKTYHYVPSMYFGGSQRECFLEYHE